MKVISDSPDYMKTCQLSIIKENESMGDNKRNTKEYLSSDDKAQAEYIEKWVAEHNEKLRRRDERRKNNPFFKLIRKLRRSE